MGSTLFVHSVIGIPKLRNTLQNVRTPGQIIWAPVFFFFWILGQVVSFCSVFCILWLGFQVWAIKSSASAEEARILHCEIRGETHSWTHHVACAKFLPGFGLGGWRPVFESCNSHCEFEEFCPKCRKLLENTLLDSSFGHLLRFFLVFGSRG